jgi:hypothetical protein
MVNVLLFLFAYTHSLFWQGDPLGSDRAALRSPSPPLRFLSTFSLSPAPPWPAVWQACCPAQALPSCLQLWAPVQALAQPPLQL